MRSLVAATFVLVGCGTSHAQTPSPMPDAGTADETAPAAAPYAAGTVFPDLELAGYLDRNGDEQLTSEEHRTFRISDVIAGSPDYLLVHVAFGWCEWCWVEAKEQMRWYRGYGGRLRIVQVYVDDLRGDRADRADLEFWIAQNKSFIPAGLEGEETLFAKFGKNATYLLIDVKNRRTIVDVGGGPPAFRRMEATLAEKLGALPPAP